MLQCIIGLCWNLTAYSSLSCNVTDIANTTALSILSGPNIFGLVWPCQVACALVSRPPPWHSMTIVHGHLGPRIRNIMVGQSIKISGILETIYRHRFSCAWDLSSVGAYIIMEYLFNSLTAFPSPRFLRHGSSFSPSGPSSMRLLILCPWQPYLGDFNFYLHILHGDQEQHIQGRAFTAATWLSFSTTLAVTPLVPAWMAPSGCRLW